MAKPHVAIVCTQHRAGDTRMFQRWVCGLAARGWRVTHIAPPDEVTLDYPLGAVAVPVPTRSSYVERITGVRQILPLLDQARPDLILFPDPELFAVLPGHGRRLGIPVVFDRHENFEHPSTFPQAGTAAKLIAYAYAALERRLTRRVQGVIVVLDEMRAALDSRVPIMVARNYPTRSLLESLGGPPRPETERFTCVHLGSQMVERGLYETLEIARTLVKDRHRDDFSLCLGGRFPRGQFEHCAAFVDRHDLAKNLRLIDGHVAQAQVAELYRGSQIGLSPYLQNPAARVTLQNKILEFMGAGLPVITSPSSLNGQVVQESGCGMLFWASEIGAICDQIETWMDDPELARATGRRGRDYVLDKLVWDAELERLEPWLLGLCGADQNP